MQRELSDGVTDKDAWLMGACDWVHIFYLHIKERVQLLTLATSAVYTRFTDDH